MSGTAFLSERPAVLAPVFDTLRPAPGASFFTGLMRAAFTPQPDGSATSVLLAAPERRSGVSFICSSIAAELAASGSKVLLADAQTIAAIRNPNSAVGYCEHIGADPLWVLGYRQLPDEDSRSWHRLASPIAVLDVLKREFSHIVVDAPALAVSDAALLLATSVASVVLVAKSGQTETRTMASASRRLTSLGARVIGSVYNER